MSYVSIIFFNKDVELHFKVKGYVSEILEEISEQGNYIKTITIGDKAINGKYVELSAICDLRSYLDSINYYLGYLEEYQDVIEKKEN